MDRREKEVARKEKHLRSLKAEAECAKAEAERAQADAERAAADTTRARLQQEAQSTKGNQERSSAHEREKHAAKEREHAAHAKKLEARIEAQHKELQSTATKLSSLERALKAAETASKQAAQSVPKQQREALPVQQREAPSRVVVSGSRSDTLRSLFGAAVHHWGKEGSTILTIHQMERLNEKAGRRWLDEMVQVRALAKFGREITETQFVNVFESVLSKESSAFAGSVAAFSDAIYSRSNTGSKSTSSAPRTQKEGSSSSLESQLGALQRENSQLRAETERLKKQLAKVDSGAGSNTSMEKELRILKRENTQLQAELDRASNGAAKAAQAPARPSEASRLTQLKTELSEAQREVKQLQADARRHRTELQEAQQSRPSRALEQQLGALQSELKGLRGEQVESIRSHAAMERQLEREKKELKAELQQLRRSSGAPDSSSSITELQAELADARREATKAIEQQRSQQQLAKKAEAELATLRDGHRASTGAKPSAAEDKLRSEVSRVCEANRSLQQDLDAQRKHSERLQSQLDTMESMLAKKEVGRAKALAKAEAAEAAEAEREQLAAAKEQGRLKALAKAEASEARASAEAAAEALAKAEASEKARREAAERKKQADRALADKKAVSMSAVTLPMLLEAPKDPMWEPLLAKIAQARECKSKGDYNTAMKLEMSMAADEHGLRLMQLCESFDEIDKGGIGVVSFDQILDGFEKSASVAGLHLMMDLKAATELLRNIPRSPSLANQFDFPQFAAAIVFCGTLVGTAHGSS